MRCDVRLAEIYTRVPVKQLCFNADGEYLFAATTRADSVYRVKDGSLVGSWSFEAYERTV